MKLKRIAKMIVKGTKNETYSSLTAMILLSCSSHLSINTILKYILIKDSEILEKAITFRTIIIKRMQTEQYVSQLAFA